MDTRLYLTVAAIVAILYALAFLLFPVHTSLFFSVLQNRVPSGICDFAERRFWLGA